MWENVHILFMRIPEFLLKFLFRKSYVLNLKIIHAIILTVSP